MIGVRLHPATPAPLLALQSALGIRVSAQADPVWTTATCVVRRLAAVHAPCSRRELLIKAKLALADVLESDPTPVLHEVLNDLIASGDLMERVGLKASEQDAAVLLFLTPPRFARTVSRIYLRGVVADDAPCLPKSVSTEMVCAGSLRFLDTQEVAACAELLQKLDLAEEPVEGGAVAPRARSPIELIEHLRSCLATGPVWKEVAEERWLSHNPTAPYAQRWISDPSAHGLQIGRIPQFFGAHAWVVVDHDATPPRYVQLPLKGMPDERGCDAAWRLQLALDSAMNQPARYAVTAKDGVARVTVGFPLPDGERRKLLYLGATRPGLSRPYDFFLPCDVMPAAVATLASLAFTSSSEASP